jgi:hypothetical protein
MKPRPTDFLGVRFRSKCEAMFALYLTQTHFRDTPLEYLSTCEKTIFYDKLFPGIGGIQYEPRTDIDSWNPDFLIWNWGFDFSVNNVIPFFPVDCWFAYIEYKPKRPSIAYLDNWIAGVKLWHEQEYAKELIQFCPQAERAFALYYGSVFEENRNANCGRMFVDIFTDKNGTTVYQFEDRPGDWVSERESIVRQYRFDLVDGGAACSHV